MKSKFKLIEYNNIPYPERYICKIKEVAGHLDKEEIEDKEVYSLHTEYSYGKRKFNRQILEKYLTLKESKKDGVPQLWKNEKWAKEFADFIIELTSSKKEPYTIEIHPPFSDYTDLNAFVGNYKIFENRIKEVYFNAKIFIENRAGTVYHGGKFIISKAEEVASLCK